MLAIYLFIFKFNSYFQVFEIKTKDLHADFLIFIFFFILLGFNSYFREAEVKTKDLHAD